LVRASDRASDLWGGPPVGSRIEELFGPRGAEARLLFDRTVGRHSDEVFWESRETPGGTRWLQFNLHPVGAEGRCDAVLVVAVDATDSRRWDDWQSRLEKEQGLGLLAGAIARELNDLMAGVMGLIDVTRLHLKLGRVDAGLERLDRAGAQFDRGKDLLLRLMALSPTSHPVRSLVALGPLLRPWTEESLAGSPWTIECAWDGDELLCQADAAQLKVLWTHLVANAREASPSGGRLTIGAQSLPGPPELLCLSLTDSGPGVSAALRERLFDPFFTTKPDHPGLGLTAARTIAEHHGGWIDLESLPGAGTRVTVSLPRFAVPLEDPDQLLFPFAP